MCYLQYHGASFTFKWIKALFLVFILDFSFTVVLKKKKKVLKLLTILLTKTETHCNI